MNAGLSYFEGLVRQLVQLPRETEWVEFKENNDDPQKIGEYISALSNGAALCEQGKGYLIIGVRDDDHAIVGTTADPQSKKKGNEELETWLLRNLTPRINFRFGDAEVDGKRIVVVEIDAASYRPVSFQGVEYVRIGTSKRKLKDFPEKERQLWRTFDREPFESGIALARLSKDDVLETLDYPSFYSLLKAPLPDGHAAILEGLQQEHLIVPNMAGGWDVTNLGGMLFARRLDDFPTLKRKALRVIQYGGRDRIKTIREQVGGKGYASGFEGLLDFINGLLPRSEVIERAFRREVPQFPETAVRELVANALIHQDFAATGTGPTIELFEDRLEVTNPGQPIIDTSRFVDARQSRNERLAALMHRLYICEERGSGIDKVLFHIELHQLPPPLFEAPPNDTRATLFAPKPLTRMDKSERVRACYLHACLRYVQNDYLTNASLRERFGVEPQNKAKISRYIKEAVEAGAIAPHDAKAARNQMKYRPIWAVAESY